MKEKPCVSVVVPVYNVEDYLAECLDSILAQTLRQIEIVCVDDGSSDRSPEILEEYSRKDARVRVIMQRNAGPSAARNSGFSACEGEYILFLDSDDYILPDTLATLYSRAKDNALDILYYGAESFYESVEQREKHAVFSEYYYRTTELGKCLSGSALFSAFCSDNKFRVSVPLQLIRRDFMQESGLHFEEGMLHEDEVFSALLLAKAQKAMCIADRFYRRRVRGNSIMTATASVRRFDGQFTAFAILLRESMAGGDCADSLVNRAIAMLRASQRTYAQLKFQQRKELLLHAPEGIRTLFQEMHFGNVNYQTLAQEKAKVRQLTGELNAIRGSLSFRVGRCITLFPRKIRTFLRCLRELGFKATMHLILQKLGIEQRFVQAKQRREYQRRVAQLENMPEPVVSVIMPVYNVQEYLRQCIYSILAQTLRNFELICVDDGSTDASMAILQDYAAADSRVHILTQKNCFAGVARNNGMASARGKYLLFLDSDDFFEPDMLMGMCMEAEKTNAQVCLCDADLYDTVTGQYTRAGWLLRQKFIPNKRCFSAEDCKEHLFQITSPAPWTKLFRRDFVQEQGITYQPLPRANDLCFVLTALALANSITTVPRVYVHYRVGNTASLQGGNAKTPTAFIEAQEGLYANLVAHNVPESTMQSFADLAVDTSMSALTKMGNAPEAMRIALLRLATHMHDWRIDDPSISFTLPEKQKALMELLKGATEAQN